MWAIHRPVLARHAVHFRRTSRRILHCVVVMAILVRIFVRHMMILKAAHTQVHTDRPFAMGSATASTVGLAGLNRWLGWQTARPTPTSFAAPALRSQSAAANSTPLWNGHTRHLGKRASAFLPCFHCF